MPDVTITIPTAQVGRVSDAVKQYGPSTVPNDLPADKTPDEWTPTETLAVLQDMIRLYVTNLVKSREVEIASAQAAEAKRTEIDTAGLVT